MLRRVFLMQAAVALTAAAQATSSGTKLAVQVKYTGAGTVDDKHKLFVVLWDSPDFMTQQNSMPIGLKMIDQNGGTATFEDPGKSTVYVSTVYDASGSWDAMSVPPDGDSLGVYSTQPGVPAPIELKDGKTVTIAVSFGDEYKSKR